MEVLAMRHRARRLLLLASSIVLLNAMVAAPATAQGWSADVLDPSTVNAAATGAVVPATDLAAAPDQPQNLGLIPMAGTPAPPEGSMAQRYVFVRNGQTLDEWPPEARGRIALVKLVDPKLPATPFALVANNAAAAGAVAVILISTTTNPTAVTAPIPAANILPAEGELLVDLIDGTTDAADPANGAISAFPIRINPFVALTGTPVPIPPTIAGGAYHGTRVAPGVRPDFPQNPNTLTAFNGPALAAAIFPVGREAAEPTLGVNRNGTAFYAAATFDTAVGVLPRTLVMRSRDGGRSWQSISPELPEPLRSEPPVNGDPMVYVEEDTGRVFSLDTYDADCMWLLFTDDEGGTWNRNPVVCDVTPAVTDHQTIFAGPPPPGMETLGLLFPEIVYTCYNTVASTNCLRSLDGGLTWTKAGFAYTGVEPDNDGPGPHEGVPGLCGGLTAHLRTDSAGRVFLPAGRCGLPSISISQDAGMTWQKVFVNRDIPLPGTEHENTTAVDAADNLYMTWWDENDRLPYLTLSRDHGLTWSAPLMIAPPGVQEVNFPTLDAGDEGRIVIHFPGTVVADRNDGQRPWNLYEIVSTNALAENPLFVFTIANDAAEPIHRGPCGPGRCAGMFDFLDVVVPPADVPAMAEGFWAAGVDTCDAGCERFGTPAGGMDGIVIRQVAGPSLRAEPLRVEDNDPAIEYKGGWHRRQDADASGGTYHRRVGGKNGGGATPTARLVFAGDAVTYFHATSAGGGTADVFIDGKLARTVSFAGTTDEPSFGAAARFDGLGEGSHEILVAHRTGIAYLDAFEIDPASSSASADAAAPLARSVTQVSSALLGGLPGAVATATVMADPATEEISVVVEGSAKPLAVRLLGPAGNLVASGGALLDGQGFAGLDAPAAAAGLYTVQVVNQIGGAGAVQISVARTVRAE
jgi:PA domain-containing protein